MSVQSRGILVHRSNDERSRTPSSYKSDSASTRDTIQFQDLHVFRQYPMQPLPPFFNDTKNNGMMVQPSPVPSQTTVRSDLAPKSQRSSLGDSASRQLSHLGEVFIEKIQLDKQCLILIKDLTTVLKLSQDYLRDVERETETSANLLAELERKIRPFLINLDEMIVGQQELIKKNVDKCVVTDPKLNWLLRYNKFMLDFRLLIQRLTLEVYEKLDQLLRLKSRGCGGMLFSTDQTHQQLAKLGAFLEKIQDQVRQEMAKSEASYETEERIPC